MKKRIFLCFLALGILMLWGCGQRQQEEKNYVRYIEEPIDLLKPIGPSYGNIVQEGNEIRIAEPYGGDLVSRDGGETFVRDTVLPVAAYRGRDRNVMSIIAAGNGSRVLGEYNASGELVYYLISADGSVSEIKNPQGEGDFFPTFYYGEGSFYYNLGSMIYQLNPEEGKAQLLMESPVFPYFLTAHENMLYLVHDSGVLLYDIENGQTAQKQDEVLSQFIVKEADLLLYPYESGVYLLGRGGLYWHELYESTVERVIDSAVCGIASSEVAYAGMAVLEGEEGNTFFIFYEDGSLTRYTCDVDFVFSQENYLRIYSVYEDDNIRSAVNAFRQLHPELYVEYDVAIASDYGMTLEDALRNLSTEIASGQGPDVLVMDDIPYASYVEKGVLMDLSGVERSLKGNYFRGVLEGMASDEGLYAMPVSFALPVIVANGEWAARLEDVQSLSQLANLMETAGAETDSGALIGITCAQDTLQLLAQSSMGAWLDEDRNLDREAVTEFLTQVKRIHNMWMEKLPDEYTERIRYFSFDRSVVSYGFENTSLNRRFKVGMQYMPNNQLAFFPDAPFFAGYLEPEDFVDMNTMVEEMEGNFFLLPGQRYNTCLPIGLLGINSGTKNLGAAEQFLEYALSEAFQMNMELRGFPVNEEAYLAKQQDPRGEGYSTYTYELVHGLNWAGEYVYLWGYWPSSEAFARLDELIGSIDGVNVCESMVYGTVVEKALDVLNGDLDVEDGVAAIEQELRIYLAE